jgi:hypothetical protein
MPAASPDLNVDGTTNKINKDNNMNPIIPSYKCIRSKVGFASLLNFNKSDCNIRLYTDVIPK